MSSRKDILNALTLNQPEQRSLPLMDMNEVIIYEDVCLQFKSVLENIGGKVESGDLQILVERLKTDLSTEKRVINTISVLGEVEDHLADLSAVQLENLETVYIQGTVGVAENGAVWLNESQMQNRLLPFICQHLILVINEKDIVPTMHDVYKRTDLAIGGFGVFIAGPSKTADIEQSLVIGAHGARNTTIYILTGKPELL